MNEQLWRSDDRTSALLGYLQNRVSARKCRLMALAFLRALWQHKFTVDEARLLEVVEHEADQLCGKVSDEIINRTAAYRRFDLPAPPNERLLGAAAHPDAWQGADMVAYDLAGRYKSPTETWEAVECVLCGLIREVTGNPFRLPAFDAAWRTDTVLLLARQMYEARDFSAAPILADALQDAGCDDADILGHLRDPDARHVRGCWALDLVLGKE